MIGPSAAARAKLSVVPAAPRKPQPLSSYTTIIGLEVHVQLATRAKLFCGCSTQFGAPPNTQTCPVCTGMPGALPVLNRKAFQLALTTAVALNCQIPPLTKWDRKNYYYPDLPKGYQISQFDLPMSHDGYLDIQDAKGAFSPKRVGILRAHLEEDAGKSMHDEAAAQADSRIDLNRCGTPLLEIVSQPDMRSPAEAKAYLTELKLLLTYLGVSDCNMQEGSLRVDANVNLHLQQDGQQIATPIVEVKNMNSFRAVERALAYEAQRQYEQWQQTGRQLGDPKVTKETRGWDDTAQLTRAQRGKEESSDYRYFPEPDLVPVTVRQEEIQDARDRLGELPAALRQRLQQQYGINAYDSDVLVNQGRALVDYYLAVAEACGDGKLASNWVQQDVLRYLNENEIPIDQYPLDQKALGQLLQIVVAGDLTTGRAREVLAQMIETGQSADQVMEGLGIQRLDDSQLRSLCQQLIDAHPKIVADIQGGKLQAVGALIGKAKQQNPDVDPGRVRELLIQLAGNSP
ncbi:MAG: Asp-tRNA(Asn)/Glu-tRNA(Gln) amidotransferase subunit GatB [Planctomycetales bacterium]|nr:Asp-tRNA(Asn)/Glu-tRNA(Gln) amidotransferase subunit GatB [Planctomycetales bacterium]NIM07640.1 Asp-tRNA(Asn)/Glu-tRNA(Gln) amidotransferase subunit GatB [Planctomycetales bacterium]NIN07146.1 Asp-tRNA(Asn)/Glu-tRNA(Gln) amidotransferase subunit GatB [Planctomycetales bacterium]NIN76240.1 Asp-tRNA(Asn)/Glu-tRNA(Gln) amidotransferase subunit GatB [Planctomycetales bacterium]NIO33456.1 Asp-tRNA(Asn)/Glu-tRNA(Gln) amidotransferase subunit GatB [Planctomycetales bacterium]